MHIKPAAEEHVAEINQLIARSKSHWAWTPEYLVAALPLLMVTRSYLRENLCFELREIDQLVARAGGRPGPQTKGGSAPTRCGVSAMGRGFT